MGAWLTGSAVVALLGVGAVVNAPDQEIASTEPGQLSFVGCFAQTATEGCFVPASPALNGAHSVAVSPDGTSLYVVSTNSSSISHFDRDPGTGRLDFVGCFAEKAGAGCSVPEPAALNGAINVAVSPDGTSVYVTSYSSHSISHFSRDPTTGRLQFVECFAETAAEGCSVPSSASLNSPTGVAVSPDGESVYVAASTSDSISHFSRNPSTGRLDFAGCFAATAAEGCSVPSPAPLDGATGIAVSPDARSIYVASSSSDSISRFSRDAADGRLRLVSCFAETASEGCAVPAPAALDGARSVAVSPDSASVYVTSTDSGSISQFHASPGALEFARCLAATDAEGCPAAPQQALQRAEGVTVGPDGASVYVASEIEPAISDLRGGVDNSSMIGAPQVVPTLERYTGGPLGNSVILQGGPLRTQESLSWFWPIDVRGIIDDADILEFDGEPEPYYGYYSTDHDDGRGGIRLATAQTPVGPWHKRNAGGSLVGGTGAFDGPNGTPIYAPGHQAETPAVIDVPDDPDGRRLYMFLHRIIAPGNQGTYLATSANGLNWTDEESAGKLQQVGNPNPGVLEMYDGFDWGVAADRRHLGYFRPFPVPGGWAAYSAYGGGPAARGAVWRSPDARQWTLELPSVDTADVLTPEQSGHKVANSGNFVTWRGEQWVVSLRSPPGLYGTTRFGRRIMMTRPTGDLRGLVRPSYVLTQPEGPYESDALHNVRTLTDRDGTVYVYWMTDLPSGEQYVHVGTLGTAPSPAESPAPTGYGSISVLSSDLGPFDLRVIDCLSEVSGPGCSAPADAALNEARGVAVSPDGTSIYVASWSSDAISQFALEPIPPPEPEGGEAVPPDTTITKRPKNKSKKKKAVFEFSSDTPGSNFECSLDGAPFEPCASPQSEKVRKGRHSFRVRAVDVAGNTDPSPAAASWKVVKRKPSSRTSR